MKQSITLITLFICLNGRLYSTNRDVEYFPVEKTVKVDNAIDMKQSCFHTLGFKDGFESITIIKQNKTK